MGLLDSTTQGEYYQGNDLGNYQFTSLDDIITQFEIAYVGDDKIISKIKRMDIAFHAQRALQEFSFDTLKSVKAHEVVLSPSLQMPLPQDYVNYTKVSWVDSAGIKHLLYPASKTSNPFPIKTDSNGDYVFDVSGEGLENTNLISTGGFEDATAWTLTGSASPQWIIGDIDITQSSGTIYTYKNVAQAGQGGNWGWMETAAPDIIEGRRYKITYDIIVPSASGQLVLANHTTNASTLNSDPTDDNVDLIAGASPVGTYSVEWIQGSKNTGKIKLYNDSSYKGVIDNVRVVLVGGGKLSTTWSNYKSGTPSENQDDYQDDTYWPAEGSRFGLDPQHAQTNGSFFIDQQSGKIHFSSNINGKTVILDYISDSLGTDGEMQVHKFAEEAMYKHIAHAILATRANTPEYVIQRFKKERFAAVRTAKLRLSNLKLEELTQILRGKSKQIKH